MLVPSRRKVRPYTGGYLEKILATQLLESFSLLGRANHSMQAAITGQQCQPLNVIRQRTCHTKFGEIFRTHAGQHSNGDQSRFQAMSLQTFPRCFHHAPAPTGMHIDHPHSQLRRSLNGCRHSVGNVMKLEVKKNLKTASMQRFDNGRTTTGKQFLAHFYPTTGRLKPVSQAQSGIQRGMIKGNDQG